MSQVEDKKETEKIPYKVKDISLSDWGRKEIKLAEAEMPGLMALKRRVRESKTSERRTNCRVSSYDNSDCGFN